MSDHGDIDPRAYPAYPLLAVSAAVFRNGAVLLARRARPPLVGRWSLPGGLVEAGERLEEASAREVMEETGVHAQILGLADVVQVVRHDDAGAVERHYVILSFAARWLGGEPAPGPEASDVAWVRPDSLDGLDTTEGLSAAVARAAAVLRSQGNAIEIAAPPD